MNAEQSKSIETQREEFGRRLVEFGMAMLMRQGERAKVLKDVLLAQFDALSRAPS